MNQKQFLALSLIITTTLCCMEPISPERPIRRYVPFMGTYYFIGTKCIDGKEVYVNEYAQACQEADVEYKKELYKYYGPEKAESEYKKETKELETVELLAASYLNEDKQSNYYCLIQ
ncbi:MAG: hypothetical protein NTZ68_03335 [Candidatus Dependentiae bacterium]|nr:hypothetical protein [Candidatus Dependentiae bacterium]